MIDVCCRHEAALQRRPRGWVAFPSRLPRQRRRIARALLLLAGYVIFCHGCHGDEDDQLLAMETARASVTAGECGWELDC